MWWDLAERGRGYKQVIIFLIEKLNLNMEMLPRAVLNPLKVAEEQEIMLLPMNGKCVIRIA